MGIQCLVILTKKETVGCFALIGFLVFLTVRVLWLFLTVPCIALQYLVVVFPDHTYLLFGLFVYIFIFVTCD